MSPPGRGHRRRPPRGLVVLGASAYAPAMGIVLVAMVAVTAVTAIATVNGRARASIGRELRLATGALRSPATVLRTEVSAT